MIFQMKKPPERIIGEFKGVVDTVRNINSGGKVIVSSVLPHRNDKLVNKVIDQTNLALRKICDEKSCHYLDNYPLFCKNGMPDAAFYKDNMNLNAKGGKVLDESIRQKLNSILSVQENQIGVHISNRTEQNFQKGRLPGRRNHNQNHNQNRQQAHQPMMFMPMPFFPPPWYQPNNNPQNPVSQ